MHLLDGIQTKIPPRLAPQCFKVLRASSQPCVRRWISAVVFLELCCNIVQSCVSLLHPRSILSFFEGLFRRSLWHGASKAMGSWSQRLPQRAALEQKHAARSACDHVRMVMTHVQHCGWIRLASILWSRSLGPSSGPLSASIWVSATLESVCGACMHAVRTDVWLHRSLRSKIATRG